MMASISSFPGAQGALKEQTGYVQIDPHNGAWPGHPRRAGRLALCTHQRSGCICPAGSSPLTHGNSETASAVIVPLRRYRQLLIARPLTRMTVRRWHPEQMTRPLSRWPRVRSTEGRVAAVKSKHNKAVSGRSHQAGASCVWQVEPVRPTRLAGAANANLARSNASAHLFLFTKELIVDDRARRIERDLRIYCERPHQTTKQIPPLRPRPRRAGTQPYDEMAVLYPRVRPMIMAQNGVKSGRGPVGSSGEGGAS